MLTVLPPMPFVFRAVLALVLLGATWFWPRTASAQTVTINASAVLRQHADGSPYALPGRNLINWVNFNDCEGDLHLSFPLVLDGTAVLNTSLSLQVWAGDTNADCSQLTSRNAQGTATQVCWPAVNGSVTKSATVNLTIPVRDILSQFGAGGKGAYQGPYGETACHNPALPTGPTNINVWFLLLQGDGTSTGTPAQYQMSVDLLGPAPPAGVSAGIGDTALILSWTPSSDPDTQGYTIYCDPPPNGNVPTTDSAPPAGDSSTTTTPVDAGSTLVCVDGGFTDGGVDEAGNPIQGEPIDGGCSLVPNGSSSSSSGGSSSGTVGGGSNCPSTILVSGGGTRTTNEAGATTLTGGAQHYIDPAYICGNIGSVTSKGATAANLSNGTLYTVAVAGIDNYGNTGPLGDPACDTPQEVLDFWDQYKQDGGGAGGGFCSVDGVGLSATATPMLVFGMWAAIAALRRRTARSRRNRDEADRETRT